jgi:hypothetical protein
LARGTRRCRRRTKIVPDIVVCEHLLRADIPSVSDLFIQPLTSALFASTFTAGNPMSSSGTHQSAATVSVSDAALALATAGKHPRRPVNTAPVAA